jgi:hypothetical protein
MPKLTQKPLEVGELIYVRDPDAPENQYRGVISKLDPLVVTVWPDAGIEPAYEKLDQTYIVDEYFKLDAIRRIQWQDVALIGYAEALSACGQRPPAWEPKASKAPDVAPDASDTTDASNTSAQTSLFAGVSNAKIREEAEKPESPYSGPPPAPGDTVKVLPTKHSFWRDHVGKTGQITSLNSPSIVNVVIDDLPYPAVDVARFEVIKTPEAPTHRDVS